MVFKLVQEKVAQMSMKDISGIIIAFAALYSALTVLGVGFITPWPARAEVQQLQDKITKLEQSIDQIKADLTKVVIQNDMQNCTMYRLLRDNYRNDLESAERELRKDPSASPARKQKADAEENIATMDAKLHSPPCL